MKKTSLWCMVCCVLVVSAYANEWHNPAGIEGQDSDWYNSLNWSDGHVPTSSEMTYWRYASSDGVYHPIIINGGTAVSATSTCGIWYAGTARLTVTNGAVFSISGGLNLQNSAADAAHSPANIELTINGGSTVNISGETQVGRKFTVGTAFGQCTLNIDGAGTTLNQDSYMWFGWGDDKTISTRMNVTNGATVNFITAGGLRFQPDLVNNVTPILNIAGGFVNIKGNRTADVNNWLSNSWLIAYDGDGAITFSYDSVNDYTRISSIELPVYPDLTTTVTCFSDDFEGTHTEDYYWCDDPLNICTPPIGNMWMAPNMPNPANAKVNCTAFSGRQVASLYRDATSGTAEVIARGKPVMQRTKGFIYRFEFDYYVVPYISAVESSMSFRGWSYQNLFQFNIWGRGMLRYSTVSAPAGLDSAKSFYASWLVGQWVHARVEMLENNKWYLWMTPEDNIERLVVSDGYWVPQTVAYDIRTIYLNAGTSGEAVYIDNVKMEMIDLTPAGYPTVAPLAQPVVIDGQVDVVSEWANAKKTAHKPLNSRGNFIPNFAANWDKGLADSTVADVYATYDSQNFYVAMVCNNVMSSTFEAATFGRVDAIFTFEDESSTSTGFRCYALTDNTDPNAFQILRSIDAAAETILDYAAFTAAGGQMAYTISGDVIKAEMKIPFSYLGCNNDDAPTRFNVQFNFVEQPTGDHRGTTNALGEFMPGRGYGVLLAPSMTGLVTAMPGDWDGSCAVDIDDLYILVQYWLTDSLLSGDGSVDATEFSEIASHWLLESAPCQP